MLLSTAEDLGKFVEESKRESDRRSVSVISNMAGIHMTKKDDVMGFVQSRHIDRVAAYAQSGRKHASLSLEKLNLAWEMAFHELAARPADPDIRALHDNYDSELALRGAEPPYHLVKDELEALCAKAGERVAELE